MDRSSVWSKSNLRRAASKVSIRDQTSCCAEVCNCCHFMGWRQVCLMRKYRYQIREWVCLSLRKNLRRANAFAESKRPKSIEQLWQQRKLKCLAWTLPVVSSILGQRLAIKKNHQTPTVSEVLTSTLFKTSSEQTAFRRKRMETSKNCQKQPRTQMKAMPVLQPRARRPRRMRIVLGRKSTNMPALLPERKRASITSNTCPSKTRQHMPASLLDRFYQSCARPLATLGHSEACQNMPASLLDRFAQTCTRPLPTLGQGKTCQNMPAKLLDRFDQTCTRPLPTLGQSETCQNMQASLLDHFDQTCRRPLPTFGQSETFRNMPASLPKRKRASIASTAFLANMHKASSHMEPKQNMPKHASIIQHPFYTILLKHAQGPLPTLGQSETCQNMPASLIDHFDQTCRGPLPTLGQSEKTCQHRF